jgi:hypothetical protein
MKRKRIFLFGMIVLFSQCRKDGQGCWQAFDPSGYDVPGLVLCNKTKAEAEAAYPQYWFHPSGEKKYCWLVQIGATAYRAWDVPESMAKKYMEYNGAYHFTKIDCKSFCQCTWHEKHKSKSTGAFRPTLLIVETLLSGDSCGKLSVGKIVTVKETVDSLITRELTEKHPWFILQFS